MQVYESQGIARKEAMKLVAKDRGSVRGCVSGVAFVGGENEKDTNDIACHVHAIGV